MKDSKAKNIQAELYKNLEELRKDSEWLTQTCSLPHFSNFKLSKYEYDELVKQLTSHTTVSNDMATAYYEKIFDAFNLIKPKWTKTINDEMFPTLALIPSVGMCVILEKTPQWRI